MSKNLYRVTCRGMQAGIGSGTAHGVAYVIATDPAEAYRLLRSSLDARDLGFTKDRTLDRIELLAEEGEYPSCGTALYIG